MMSFGWSLFVIALTLVNVAAAGWLIWWSSHMGAPEGETTGHVWDGDIVEGNNPLPRWWLGLFWITIIFGCVFFVMYPSFGDFSLLGWSQTGQYEEEVAAAEAVYGEIFAEFAATPISELANDPEAMSAGRNLFVNNCAACHGSDARGARGFPNLVDAEWQWGGDPEQIRMTISSGRTGIMPPFAASLDEATRELLADYVMALAGRDVDPERVTAGEQQYRIYCFACHGLNGEGNQLLGGLPLANEIWRHGAGRSVILDVISNGRNGEMPAQEPLLGADRVHVLAAYVLSLVEQEP
jgi:cytochrome c oxidase cbb3-type subunit 3